MHAIKQPNLWSIPVLIFLLAIQSCSQSSENVLENKPTNFCLTEPFLGKVEFTDIKKTPIIEKLHLTGTVESNPDKVLSFISLVSGIITNTYFSIGDEVKKGQVLAELNSTELTSMQSEQKELTSLIRVATKKLQSTQSMYENGISSEKDLIEAQSDLDVLETNLYRVTTNLNLFSPSGEPGVFEIKSPVSGIITSKRISGGSQISSEGEPLFTISNLDEIWVMANVYTSNVGLVQKGMKAEVKTLAYQDFVKNGEVSVISQVLDPESNVVKARIVLENKNLQLKPGMLVDVYLDKPSSKESIAVSNNHLIFDSNQNFALVYRNECEIEVRKVEIFSKNEGISYLASGLEEGETIISKNQLLIYEQIKNFEN